MNTKFNKLLPLAGVMCGLLVSTVSAASNDDMHGHRSGQNNMHHNDNGQYREITPNAGPRVSNGADVFITADFIYWVGRTYDQLYSISDGIGVLGTTAAGSTAAGANSARGIGDMKTLNNNFDPGFKVGLGLNLSHDGWDTFLEYTWFHANNTSTSTGTDNQNTVTDIAGAENDFDATTGFTNPYQFDTISRSENMRFNNFDWSLGRNFYVSQYMSLRPHIGLKGGWARITKETKEDNILGLPSTNDDSCYGQFKKRNKIDPWWIGIRGGVDPTFYFTKNWSMFGKLALSTLWRGTTEKVRDTVDVCDSTASPTGDSTNVIIRQFNGVSHDLTGVLEWQLGLCYDYWWNDDDYHFGIAASWENQKWDDMFWFQGFTLKFRFDF